MFRGKPLTHQWSHKPHAFKAELDDDGDSACSSVSGDSDEADAAYLRHSCAPNEEFEDFEDAIEQDIVCAFLDAQCDLH